MFTPEKEKEIQLKQRRSPILSPDRELDFFHQPSLCFEEPQFPIRLQSKEMAFSIALFLPSSQTKSFYTHINTVSALALKIPYGRTSYPDIISDSQQKSWSLSVWSLNCSFKRQSLEWIASSLQTGGPSTSLAQASSTINCERCE
ncbi:hypothetical protein C0J52_23969 [Blattella germanica]|nr:hypothetical protein C0J52_23969 [Blattella germanica]